MNRQQRRALGKQIGKEATSTIDLMLQIPTMCFICEALYDKKNREMVNTWSVEVFNEQKLVKLYCPECFEKRKK
jgi:hypothetical protein